MLNNETMKAIVEGMLFVSEKPVTLKQMVARLRHVNRAEQDERTVIFSQEFASNSAANEDDAVRSQLMQKQKELEDDITVEQVKALLFDLEQELQHDHRGLELVQVAKGYQLRTKESVSNYLRDDKPVAPSRLSPSALETLAIVAYEQPVARQKVEDIRGVDCGGVLKTLLDKDFIRMIGRSDEPGRPLVYGTTTKFLEVFGLMSLKDLPSPADFQELNFGGDVSAEATEEDDDVLESEGGFFGTSDFGDADQELLNESERALLEELDSTLTQLKVVEKGMVVTEEEDGDGRTQGAAPTDTSL